MMKANLLKSFLLALIVAMLPQLASAYDFMVNNIAYNINSDGNSAIVTYTSLSDNYSGLTTANIPSTVTYNGTTYSVTGIDNYAFEGCTGLTSVTIPNSVTYIGYQAFIDCTGLASITIPNSVTTIGPEAFWNCSGLTSVAIPNSVTYIGKDAFRSCTSLTSVTIPNSVSSIGEGAFNVCYGLNSIVVESGNSKYDSRDNCNAIIETATNTLIFGCKNTIIPNSVTSIGNSAFWYCTGLTSVTIPNSVTTIGVGAFSECTGLASLTIGNSVTTIKSSAFNGCTSLTSVTIPNSVIYLDGFSGCTGLTSVTIGNSVETLDGFAYCTGLTSVTIPNSVTEIGSWAFNSCTGLTSVTIPNSVTSVGKYAFYRCTGLNSVIIGNSVTEIGSSAFLGDNSLTSIFCRIPTPISISNDVFSNYNANLYVSPSSVSAYQAASPWGQFNVIADNNDHVSSITLDATNITMNIGESHKLNATVLPETALDKSLTWSSSDATVASVDSLGNVTALKGGSATITATSNDGTNISASCLVTVFQPVTGITLNRHEHTLYNGTSSSDLRSFQLTATTTPSNAYNSAVLWTSSNDSVATVTSDGTVSAVSRGTATITATTTDGSNVSDSCIVTVEQLVTGINFNFPSSINVGQTVILAPTVLPENANNHNVGCSSSNYDVAYVDVLPPNFAITGVSRDTVIITLRATDIGHYSCEHFLTVLQPVTGISLNENSHTLMYNGQQTYSFNLVATATPSNANNKNVTWSSSDESVATVNNSGVVTSQGLGTAVITATTADGSNLSDSCLVTVNPVPTTSISIDKVKETVIMGNTVQITGTVDEAAYIKTFNWTSSNDAVASVDQNGLVRGVGAGTVSITATTIDGSNLSASCIVQVLYPSNAAGAGDVNEDGRIDITDATLIVSYLQGNYPMAVLDEALMDVNGDGDINMSDVLRVISLIRND